MISSKSLPAAVCLILLNTSIFLQVKSQECDGGAIFTQESYLYGRFEVAMKSAAGDGIISSFFLYNKDIGCNWPEENNEIDIEMTGNNNLLYFTSHHPGTTHPWFYGENFDLGFSPHDSLHVYAIEWEPGIVRWFVDGELIYIQDEEPANDLIHPMAIFMNIWASGIEDWAGVWNPDVMPRQSQYDYVKYYSYYPMGGDYGTNMNFKFEWEDHFDEFDESKWMTSDFLNFDYNYCTTKSGNVMVEDGFLYLLIDEHYNSDIPVPVSFSVNTAELDLEPSDIIYLNGTFNNWCGICTPMIQNGDQWEVQIYLVPGRYEYLFTVNNWEIASPVPLNSACDFKPCDEWQNYGFTLKEGMEELVLDSYCWGSCEVCQVTSTFEFKQSSNKELVKIFDISGRECSVESNKLLFYMYSDGSVEKKIQWVY